MSVEAWLLVTFLMTPRTPDGQISMDATVIGVSRVYDNEKSCRNGAGQLQRKLMDDAKKEDGKIAMACLKGTVYSPDEAGKKP